MQEQTVPRLFKSVLLFIGLTVINLNCSAHAATAIRCDMLFAAANTKIAYGGLGSIPSTTYLTPTTLAKISELTSDARAKLILPPYKEIKNVHPWAAHAYKVYRQARLGYENFSPEQTRNFEQLKPRPSKDSTADLHQAAIEFPSDLAHSVLAYVVTAHELEHLIQVAKLGSLGLDEDFVEFFMRIDIFRIEAEAMRAEWEFANSLSPEAGAVLAKLALENTIDPALKLIANARNLSLQDYLKYNHSYKRYDKNNSDLYADKIRAGLRKALAQLPADKVTGIIGEWRIPRSALKGPLEFYRRSLESALPTGFKVELVTESKDVLVLRNTRPSSQ